MSIYRKLNVFNYYGLVQDEVDYSRTQCIENRVLKTRTSDVPILRSEPVRFEHEKAFFSFPLCNQQF